MSGRSFPLFSYFFLSSLASFATHAEGGEITYRQISGLTYQAIITTYTKTSSQSSDRDTLYLNWGDGTIEKVLRSNGPVVMGIPQGEPLDNNIKLNIYESSFHTFPSPQDYHLSITDPNRIGSIININGGSSINIQFHIESLIAFKDSASCPDQSVSFSASPIFITNVYDVFTYNLTTSNPDGDSLLFELIEPLQAAGFPVPNYQFPDQVSPGGNNNFSLNPRTGEIIWDAPQQPGAYSIAVKVHEWKECTYSGYVIKDILIFVENLQVSSFDFNIVNWPVDAYGNYHVTVNPGDTVYMQVANVNASDIQSFGEIYDLANPPVFNYFPFMGMGEFYWIPDSSHANGREYITVFRASNWTASGLYYKDLTLIVEVGGTSPCICGSCTTQNIPLNKGWNMISSYIIPDNPNFLDLIDNISHDIIIIKNFQGQTVIPSQGINNIGNWNILEGYQVKTSANSVFTIGCQQVNPTTNPVNLSAGWSIIPYLRNSSMDIVTALNSIISNILIVKSPDGYVYIPSIGINTIGDMEPGKGYKIKMSNSAALVYPGN